MKRLIIIFVLALISVSGVYVYNSRKATPSSNTSNPSPTINEISLKDQIIQAISQKNNWNPSNVELNIATTEGDFAKGDVKFKGEMGGGLWFAAKVNGSWHIVYDGNGIITCDQLINYQDFPKDLIPSCFNTQTNEMMTR